MNRSRNTNQIIHSLIRASLLTTLLGVSIWAFWPQGLPADAFSLEEVLHNQEPESNVSISEDVRLTSMMFDVQLWYTPPQTMEQKPRVPEPETKQVSYTLVAISSGRAGSDQTTRSAVIYDPDADQLYEVREGERVGPFVVRTISSQMVELDSGQRLARLELEGLETQP